MKIDEDDIYEQYKEDFETGDVDHLRRLLNRQFDYKSTKDPKKLYEKFLFMLTLYKIVDNRLAKERDETYILKAKMADLKSEQVKYQDVSKSIGSK